MLDIMRVLNADPVKAPKSERRFLRSEGVNPKGKERLYLQSSEARMYAYDRPFANYTSSLRFSSLLGTYNIM